MSIIERLNRSAVARESRRPVFSPVSLIVRNKVRLKVRAKVAYAIDRQAIALGEKPKDFRNLKRQNITDLGFCISVVNSGTTRLTISEVGLMGWFDSPRISLFEPMLHDNKPWPRVLLPGEEVITHFGTRLKGHTVLPQMRRVYAKTAYEETFFGGGPAIRFYARHMLPEQE